MNDIVTLTLEPDDGAAGTRIRKQAMLRKTLFLLLLGFTLIGCSSNPDISPGTLAKQKISLNNSSVVKHKLYEQYKEWQGVDYEMGGLSKDGIDCSGFVYRTFRQKLGIKIPRSTELQLKLGNKVGKNKLRPGDLVFFKTSTKVRHVGIYLENNKFLHASTSQGVIISKLDNVYWKEKFWQAKRL